MHSIVKTFYELTKEERARVNDLFAVFEVAEQLLQHLQLILTEASTETGWFDRIEEHRHSDGGLMVHLAESHWRRCHSQFKDLEEEFILAVSNAVTIGDISATCSHDAVFRVGIWFYELIAHACSGELPGPASKELIGLEFPEIAFWPNRKLRELKDRPTRKSLLAEVRDFVHSLHWHPIVDAKWTEIRTLAARIDSWQFEDDEYKDKEFAQLSRDEQRVYFENRDAAGAEFAKEMHEQLMEELTGVGDYVSRVIESRTPQIGSWIVRFCGITLAELDHLEATLVREATTAITKRLASRAGPKIVGLEPAEASALGDAKYRVKGEVLKLEYAEDRVLFRLVELSAANMNELKKTGDGSPGRTLKRIRDKYAALAPHIKLPGSKAQGGYRTTIQLHPTAVRPGVSK
jgi:hypothetical protein